MKIPDRIERAASRRVESARDRIQNAKEHIANGTSLRAETDLNRALERVKVVANVNAATAAKIVNYENPADLGLTGESLRKAEAIQGNTADYVGVAWLEAGRIASNAVARIIFRDGEPRGTGFLVSDQLLLTNNHVIEDKDRATGLIVEFRYEIRLGETAPAPIRFELDSSTFFVTEDRDDLDFTLIALGRQLTPGVNLTDFGCCPISSSSAKHSVGEPVTIVQHPDGYYKQVVLRENRIVHRGDNVLHYIADTEGGSSGSPVFNDAWQVVALHHWGSPHREQSADTNVNEGIRISAIVTELQTRSGRMNSSQQQLLQEAFNAPPLQDFGTRIVEIRHTGGPQAILPNLPVNILSNVTDSERTEERGRGGPASRIDPVYANRRGYNESFLENFLVPMPQLNATQSSKAARVRGIGSSDNPYELKYQHFSVVLNAERRMAFFSICNIDGSKRISVDRDSGKATSGPEATENWAIDPRVPEESQLNDAFYRRLRNALRGGDFFARGHLTRREDPNWGRAETAERANNDTFHHTNACPQVQTAFNGSQQAWQGIENYVLNAADDSNLRVTVITGPVFGEDDPTYDDEEFGTIALPRQFWKIVARVEDDKPLVIAILADQSEAMDLLFAARRDAREAIWDWPARLSKDYISTVTTIEELTGLDFGNLANYDVYAQETRENRLLVTSPETLFLRRFSVAGHGFGRYTSISEFLDRWERRKQTVDTAEESAVQKRTPPKPKKRERKIVEIEARVARVFADDLNGAKHQQFTIVPNKWISGTEAAKAEVEEARENGQEVRVAIRFGDSRGLADRVPGIRENVELKLKGEWISARDAFDVGGEDIPVLHFTHDPIGWICTSDDCFS
ncbi:DNA/RNA non-specific endonuclease (plasmid) [Stanieria cyanosphaera PCC 7437]|uniref:Serine protease n=1 Tax=Stanieria cyanosphaera (strain ATCC 29371 / PCC 7437) TaxID=111780 RepID=K9Y2N9_STAC7|nr:DNA/RNA non-specific endonuclease [Stanieria cyanosphaera]AFZ38292.1 DNA/RNA non-specific endonuclease [Stanieria cyanosphaera PCC 7437]